MLRNNKVLNQMIHMIIDTSYVAFIHTHCLEIVILAMHMEPHIVSTMF